MEETILHRAVPVVWKTDVLVVGGGLGGIAADPASARAGARTILLERNGYVGGVATAGLCCSVYNCLFTRDGKTAVEGIPMEIVRLLADGAGPGESFRRHKGHIIYDVEKAKRLLAECLRAAGVLLLTGMTAVDVWRDGEILHGVVAAGRNGLQTIRAGAVVDATGDADVARLAGVPMERITGNSSYVFRLGNVDLDAFVGYFRHNPEEYPEKMDIEWTLADALAQYDDNGTFLFPHGGGIQLSIVEEGRRRGEFPERVGGHGTIDAMQMHGIRDLGVVHVITGFVQVPGLEAEQTAQAVLDGREMAYAVTDFFRRRMPGFERAFVAATADDLGIRTSGHIAGDFVFTPAMQQTPSRFADAIGTGVVEESRALYAEAHAGAKNAWNAQILGRDVYEIPLRCLLPKKAENLIMGSGRSASVSGWALLRVMVTTMTVGQGAGTAAALAVKSGVMVRQVDIGALRQELQRQGVRFPD